MKRLGLGLGLVLTLVACGGSSPPAMPSVPPPPSPPIATAEPPRITPDAEFRQKAPDAEGRIAFVAPKIAEAKLTNGVRVLVVERHDLPIVSVRLVINVGAGDTPEARAGAMSFLGAMLEQGTKKRDALKLSDEFEAIGAAHGAYVDWDAAGVQVKVLSDRLAPALELMADVTLHPTFPEGEIERFRARRIAGIQSEKSNPGVAAQNTIAAVVFGRAHPYGHSLGGEEADAKKVTRAELVKAYDRLFVPKNAAIVVAGDVTEATILPKLEAAFGGWKAKGEIATRRPPKPPVKIATDKKIVFVDRAGAQSQIQIAKVGVPYSTKDRDAIVVMNAIFGGMFSSRVNLNLREKNGYTYGARSYFQMRHGAGPFQVGAAVHADKTGPAIQEIFTELDAIRKDGPKGDELVLAKESIRLAMPGRFESVSDVSSAVADLVVHDLPLDEYAQRLQRIEAVTAADVKRVAVDLIARDTMTVVVVGDKKTVGPQLERLGLGAWDERDPYGNPTSATPATKDGDKPAPAKPPGDKPPAKPPAPAPKR